MKDINYPIDYDMFTTTEVIKLINFYNLMLYAERYPYSKILEGYQEYRKTINSIALEKKYDAQFEKETGISIYRTVHPKQDQ
jgi:uncharacterized protein YktA (UPF0223 family)